MSTKGLTASGVGEFERKRLLMLPHLGLGGERHIEVLQTRFAVGTTTPGRFKNHSRLRTIQARHRIRGSK